MIDTMIQKLGNQIGGELEFFRKNPSEVNLKNIEKAVTRCYGALTLVTGILYDLGQNELGTELGQHWDDIDRPAFYDILYKSWGM